jgi:Cu/Ag efflux protein CusF
MYRARNQDKSTMRTLLQVINSVKIKTNMGVTTFCAAIHHRANHHRANHPSQKRHLATQALRVRSPWMMAWLMLPAVAFTPAHATTQTHAAVHPTPANVQADAENVWVKADVKAIDHAQQRLTLKHAAMPQHHMPAMTMVFKVVDPALLQGLAVGQSIEAQFISKQGRLQVLRIRKN